MDGPVLDVEVGDCGSFAHFYDDEMVGSFWDVRKNSPRTRCKN